MKALGVDAPFQSTRNKQTTIQRNMSIYVLDNKQAILEIILECDRDANNGDEIISLRTAATSTINNLSLICETLAHFGP